MTQPTRPTLKTIAAATGLAVATVSRALKDAPDLADCTKARVRAAAATLGYHPNRAGVRLRTGKTNVIALVLAAEAEMMNHTARLIQSVAAALRGTPYHLVVMPQALGDDPMVPIRYIVESHSADGVIMNQTRPDDPRALHMLAHGLPFATHGRTGLDHPSFDCDNAAFARIALRHLAALGRRSPLLIAPPADHSYAADMIEGFQSECETLGLAGEVINTITSDCPTAAIESAMSARFAQLPAPDAIISGSTNAAICTVTAAEAIGKTIGRDFDLVAKEATPLLKRIRPQIIVYREDVAAAGDFLARAIMARIENRPLAQCQFLDQPTAADLA